MKIAPQFDVVVLDPGHGGMIGGVYQTPGGKQYHHTDTSPILSLYEGVSNRRTAAELIPILLAAGVGVASALTGRRIESPPASWRDLEQSDVPLHTRTAHANRLAASTSGYSRCLYLSIHSNAIGNSIKGPSLPARGVDVYTSRGHTMSDQVATTIHASMSEGLAGLLRVRRGDTSDGDPDQEAGFWVLRKTKSPAVLLETGFFTNIDDARVLDSDVGHKRIARAVAGGLLPWCVRAARPVCG